MQLSIPHEVNDEFLITVKNVIEKETKLDSKIFFLNDIRIQSRNSLMK